MKKLVEKRLEAEVRTEFPLSGRVPGWYFRVEEMSPGGYLVEGVDLWGRRVSRTGTKLDELLLACEADASQIEDALCELAGSDPEPLGVDDLFEKTRGALRELGGPHGFAIVADRLDTQAFGSRCCEFRGPRSLRLVWDGREQALWAEIERGGRWTDVESLATGGQSTVDRARDLARVRRLVAAVRTVIERHTRT